MQELMIRPTIYSFDNCRQFAEEFKLGKGDLLFTNKRLFKKFFEPLGLGCDVIFREDYGESGCEAFSESGKRTGRGDPGELF